MSSAMRVLLQIGKKFEGLNEPAARANMAVMVMAVMMVMLDDNG